MLSATKALAKDVFSIYLRNMIPRASAALSYFLTMTIFPMIICLYALFGQNYQAAMNVFHYVEAFLTPSAAELFKSFLLHVAGKSSRAVLLAAIFMLAFSASATIRVLEGTVSEMQGGRRFRALPDFLISFAMAVGLLFAIYFSIVVLLTSHRVLQWVERHFDIVIQDATWTWMRYILLGSIAMLMLWMIFGFTRPRSDRYRVLPGAIFATLGIVLMSTVFSMLIASSVRYSWVYGSLASLILLMFWLYLTCQTIFIGAALNIALRDREKRIAANAFT